VRVERDLILREAMVSHLEATGVLHDATVRSALSAVPRHRFLPEMPLEDAYADRAIAIKSEGDAVISSISQPGMIVLMLELLEAARGENILEIGTGSGYNAALLATIVGSSGSVTTIDLDPDLAARARERLAAMGFANVRVVAADGASGGAQGARYDRVVVTARCDDIADAWWRALRPGARLVVPLQLLDAGEYAVGFALQGDRLESVGVHPCAFIALRGAAASAGADEVFFRNPAQRADFSAHRRVASVVAVRRENATPALLAQADVVIARAASLFGLTFA
jgi:protein-L-isoaspartate(D-aspartate) O-methyltransferase